MYLILEELDLKDALAKADAEVGDEDSTVLVEKNVTDVRSQDDGHMKRVICWCKKYKLVVINCSKRCYSQQMRLCYIRKT